VIKTIRRECLDWVIIYNEHHLKLVLRQYLDHFNRARPHLALALQPPAPEPTSETGAVVRRQRLYGLINEYSRVT
jgi:putative transposase